MTVKQAIYIMIAFVVLMLTAFLIIFGAINNDAGLLSFGTGILGTGFGAVITYIKVKNETK